MRYVDIEIDPKDFDKEIKIPIPFERSSENKIKVEYQPLTVQIKDGENWKKVMPVKIWGKKE